MQNHTRNGAIVIVKRRTYRRQRRMQSLAVPSYMQLVTFLLAIHTLAARGIYAEVASPRHPVPRTLIHSSTSSLLPGEATTWGVPLGTPLSSGNIHLDVHNTGPAAVDILIIPQDQWQQWQACRADIGVKGGRVRVEAGAAAKLTVKGECLQRWVISASHTEGAGGWPRSKNATVRLSAVGTPDTCCIPSRELPKNSSYIVWCMPLARRIYGPQWRMYTLLLLFSWLK